MGENKRRHQYGDAPIEPEYHDKMVRLANGDKKGFVLLVFPFGEKAGRCNYISNGAAREDIVTLFKEQIKRFEGQPETEGRA